MTAATPSPCPPHHVVFAAAPLQGDFDSHRYGIYLATDDWSGENANIQMQKLFDDPHMVDAEPVAVYQRKVRDVKWDDFAPLGMPPPSSIDLADGRKSSGPFGLVNNTDIYTSINVRMEGQISDAGEHPMFAAPPMDSVKEIHFYAAHRDRFDDPDKLRVHGHWKLLRRVPVENDGFNALLPGGPPTMLVAMGVDGKVVRWRPKAKDKANRRATFYAFAGDHYSGLRVERTQNCIGCHSGHSGIYNPKTGVPERVLNDGAEYVRTLPYAID